MKSSEPEEVWFARIVVLLGAHQLFDLALNLSTVLKIESNLPIISPGTSETTAVAYAISCAITGLYFVSGGRILSKLAYGRSVSRASLLHAMQLPDGAGWLSVAFRSFGASQLILAVSSIATAIAQYYRALSESSLYLPRFSSVEAGWAFEHIVIGFFLLWYGGRIARFFLGHRPPLAPPVPPQPGTPAIEPPPESSSGHAHF